MYSLFQLVPYHVQGQKEIYIVQKMDDRGGGVGMEIIWVITIAVARFVLRLLSLIIIPVFLQFCHWKRRDIQVKQVQLFTYLPFCKQREGVKPDHMGG